MTAEVPEGALPMDAAGEPAGKPSAAAEPTPAA
jgi:hypothetical protein